MLVRHLLIEKPFAASYGRAGTAWEDFADLVSKLTHGNDELVFDPAVKGYVVKDRFEKKFMPFVKL